LEDGILDEKPPHVELTGAVLARSVAHQQWCALDRPARDAQWHTKIATILNLPSAGKPIVINLVLEDGILDEKPPHVELTGAVLARSVAHQQLRVA
jgi:hypothetical protein